MVNSSIPAWRYFSLILPTQAMVIFLVKVVQGSPADKAGIRPGDIILRFNGAKVATAMDLRSKIDACKVGDRVEVVILHNGMQETKTLVLEEVPEDYRK